MSILKQGDNLEEEESQILDNTEEPEGASDGGTNIRKYAIIAAVAVIAIAVMFFLLRKDKGVGEDEEDAKYFDDEYATEEMDEDADPDAMFDDMLSSKEEEMESLYVTYSDYEIEQLRIAGYTGDEIEVSSEMGISCDTLLEEAEAARDADIKAQIKKLGKKGSKEYKQLMYKTFLANDLNTTYKTKGADEVYAERVTTREIVDFEKLEVHGSQLWIMCYLDSGEKAFFLATTSRWAALPKKGNIVVDVTREIYKNQEFIVEINEIPQ